MTHETSHRRNSMKSPPPSLTDIFQQSSSVVPLKIVIPRIGQYSKSAVSSPRPTLEFSTRRHSFSAFTNIVKPSNVITSSIQRIKFISPTPDAFQYPSKASKPTNHHIEDHNAEQCSASCPQSPRTNSHKFITTPKHGSPLRSKILMSYLLTQCLSPEIKRKDATHPGVWSHAAVHPPDEDIDEIRRILRSKQDAVEHHIVSGTSRPSTPPLTLPFSRVASCSKAMNAKQSGQKETLKPNASITGNMEVASSPAATSQRQLTSKKTFQKQRDLNAIAPTSF